MEQKPEQIQDDLRGVVRGELLFDDLSRALYSTDASIFQVRPLGVVTPVDEADVQAIVRYAAEHQIPITARGAGSGLAGESLGPGLILDFSKHFRAIKWIDQDRVCVQAGVVLRDLNRELARVGRRFAPDPASEAHCTLGGMLANNASGARALKYGYTRDHVHQLRVALDNGEVADLGREAVTSNDGSSRKSTIVKALAALLSENEELIQACQPRTRFNRCGYLLHDVLTSEGLDLARLLVGSEGTLALITEATLRTVPLSAERAMVLLGFRSLEAAAEATQDCLENAPSACELLDRRILTLTSETSPAYQGIISAATEAVLLLEFDSDAVGEATRAAQTLLARFRRRTGVTVHRLAVEEAEIDWLWQLRNLALPMLYAMPGRAQPIPLIEDVGVPVDRLPAFLRRTQEILREHQTTASFLIHAGAGQVHTRPFLDYSQPDNLPRLRALSERVHRLALDLGGTVSSQHAVGLARTPWVAPQYGRLFQVFREIKATFDAHNLFNPGKIVGGEGDALATLLRKSPSSTALPSAWRLRWAGGEVEHQCQDCNGCGACRTEDSSQRMCPLFRVRREEAATPRAKANLLRSLLDGGFPPHRLTADDVRQVADLCINCKMCALECPAHVQIPKLMLEAKALHTAEHGLGRSDWVLARTEGFAAIGSAFALIVNAALQSRTMRILLQKFLGLARNRRLPTFAPRSFMSRAVRQGWTRPLYRGRRLRVAYFVDVYANYNDPQIAEATVAVLQHQGLEVYVPRGQVGCGMAPLAYGDVDTARRMATRNVRVLADLARTGYTIVCSEPTAALMLKHDYLDLVDDPDVALIGQQTEELMAFLGKLHEQGRLRTDFQPLEVAIGHHVPCHLKALQAPVAGPQLLALIPRLRSHKIDVSCSGMAGTFGLKEENFADSLAAGEPMLRRLRQPDIHLGSSECSACRMQMEHGARKRSLHPIQYLALAYGLMPELVERLREPIRDLVLR